MLNGYVTIVQRNHQNDLWLRLRRWSFVANLMRHKRQWSYVSSTADRSSELSFGNQRNELCVHIRMT